MKRLFFVILSLIFVGNSNFIDSFSIESEHYCKSNNLKRTKRLKKRKNKKYKKKMAFSVKKPLTSLKV